MAADDDRAVSQHLTRLRMFRLAKVQDERQETDGRDEHGDEHVIKFADTAADVYARTGNADALAAAARATSLIER